MTMRLEIKAFRYDSRSEARQLALAFTSSAGAAITATTGVVSAALVDGVVGDSDHVSCVFSSFFFFFFFFFNLKNSFIWQ